MDAYSRVGRSSALGLRGTSQRRQLFPETVGTVALAEARRTERMTGFGFLFIVWMYLRFFPWIPWGATAIAVIIFLVLKRRKGTGEATFIAAGSWIALLVVGFLSLLALYPNAVKT